MFVPAWHADALLACTPAFFLSVVIVFIAVLSGSITDTFGQLREQADDTERKIAEYRPPRPPPSNSPSLFIKPASLYGELACLHTSRYLASCRRRPGWDLGTLHTRGAMALISRQVGVGSLMVLGHC